MVLEDLQWVDSETQAFLDDLVDGLAAARVLLLVNYRPEYRHSWSSKSYYTQLHITPLPRAWVENLLDDLLGTDVTLDNVKHRLIERTKGNPFFLEESVQTLVETSVLTGARGDYRLAREVESIQMPATAHAMLAARIDRLPAEHKQLLEVASVIGKDVPYTLLASVTGSLEHELRAGLATLRGAEFLYETGTFPDARYSFKHALTHEVAYASLVRERRRALHARIVEAIEGYGVKSADERVEQLAHHAQLAELWPQAATYLGQLGKRAAQRGASRDAVSRLNAALEALEHLPLDAQRLTQAIDLRLALRGPLSALGEFQQIADRLREAEADATTLGDLSGLGWILACRAQILMLAGQPRAAIEAGERAVAIGRDVGERAIGIVGAFYAGVAAGAAGDYRHAVTQFRKARESLRGADELERFGMAGVASGLILSNLTWVLTELGQFEEGVAHAEAGQRIAVAANDPYGMVWNLGLAVYLYAMRGDSDEAFIRGERGLALSHDANIAYAVPLLTSSLGHAYTVAGRYQQAKELHLRAIAAAESMNLRFRLADIVGGLVDACFAAGELTEATDAARRALEAARAYGTRGWEGWSLRRVGRIKAACGDRAAESSLREALALAEGLGMRPLQAHCHLSLGALLDNGHQRDEGREHTLAAFALYEELGMKRWLLAAKQGFTSGDQ